MLAIRQQCASRPSAALEVPNDDYVFHAVLRCGRVVSKPNKRLVTEVHDLGVAADGRSYVFEMTVLEASRLLDLYPCFGQEGLPGQWRLQGLAGLVKLGRPLEPAGGPYEAAKVVEFLLELTSCDFVRERYAESLRGPHNKWTPPVSESSQRLLA
jgi:hypothetical protein